MVLRLAMAVVVVALSLSLPGGAAATEASTVDSIEKVRSLFEDELWEMAYTSHMAKDQHDEALQVAEKAIGQRPLNLSWRKKAATSAELAGKREQALAHLLYLAEAGDGTARQSALRLSRSMQEFPVRRYLLESMLLGGDEDPQLLKEYLNVTESLGVSNEAYDLLASNLLSGAREPLLKEQARLAERLGRPAEAVNALNRLALIRPLSPEETMQRAKLMFGQGDLDRAWETENRLQQEKEATAGKTESTAEQGAQQAPPAEPAGAPRQDEPRRSYVWTVSKRAQAERKYFLIEPPMVAALVKYEFNDEVRTVAGQKQTESAHTITERVDLATKGHIYHPALLNYSLKFSPEFRQSIQTTAGVTGTASSEGNSFSPNYFTNAVLLGQKPYTLHLFAQHLEAQSWATYTGLNQTKTDSYGADLNLKYSLLPTTIGFSSSRSEQNGYYSSSSEWQEAHLFSRHSGITGESSLTANYSISKQTTNATPNEVKTLTTNFSNQYQFTKDGAVRLGSNLQYMQQDSSSIDNASLQVNEQLTWEHRKNLRSQYTLSYRQTETPTSDSYWASLDGRLTHKLYENLTTTAGVTGTSTSSTGTREKSLAGLLTTAYQRRLSSWGNLGLQAGGTYLYTTRTGARGTSQITNEPHTLSSLVETYLDKVDVVLSSIVVTNSAGTVIYVRDVDYQIDLIGNLIRVSRLPLGAISEGQLVMVNYSYNRDAGYDDAVITQNYGITLEFWQSLYLSYRYTQARQHLLAGPTPDRLSNATIHLASVRYLLGWTETGATYEDNTSSSDISYSRWEVSEAIRVRPNSWFLLNLRGYYGETSYRSYQDQKQTYGGTGNLGWIPYSWMRVDLEGYLERVDGSLEKTTNSGARAGVEMNYRLWTLRLGYKLSEQDSQMSRYNRTSQLVQMELSRALW